MVVATAERGKCRDFAHVSARKTVQQRTVLLIGSNDLLWCSLRVALRSLDEVQVVADLVDLRPENWSSDNDSPPG